MNNDTSSRIPMADVMDARHLAYDPNDKEPYKTAVWQGLQDFADGTGQVIPAEAVTLDHPEYWIARRASRNVAIAMLAAAKAADVTIEQFAALTKVAEDLAYD
jgi:uncharacterized membrane protein